MQPPHPLGHPCPLLVQRLSRRPGAPPLSPPRRLRRRRRLATFLRSQPRAEQIENPEQAADAEYRYQVQLLPGPDPQLLVQAWRRLPGSSSWHPRCGPLALAVFVRRFLPGGLPE